MSDMSYFESRPGKVSCTSMELFSFTTDLRNFERFIPAGTVSNWHAEKESCMFSVSMVGTVNIIISGQEKFSKVEYTGDALAKNDFVITLDITEDESGSAGFRIRLRAELNPVMKMMASAPINRFLEIIAAEMEKFDDWKNIR